MEQHGIARRDAAEQSARRKRQQGMSLLELLAGLTILGFVALGATLILGNSIRRSHASLQRSVAAGLASARLQRLAAQPYQPETGTLNYRLPEEIVIVGSPIELSAAAGDIPDHPEFSRTVKLVYNDPAPGMLAAHVDVFWHHHGQAQNMHSAVTFLHSGLELAD